MGRVRPSFGVGRQDHRERQSQYQHERQGDSDAERDQNGVLTGLSRTAVPARRKIRQQKSRPRLWDELRPVAMAAALALEGLKGRSLAAGGAF